VHVKERNEFQKNECFVHNKQLSFEDQDTNAKCTGGIRNYLPNESLEYCRVIGDSFQRISLVMIFLGIRLYSEFMVMIGYLDHPIGDSLTSLTRVML